MAFSVATTESDKTPYAIVGGTSIEYGLHVGEIYANWVAGTLRLLGIPKDKIFIRSYGKERPIQVGDWEQNMDESMGRELLNNRVEIRLPYRQ